MNFGEKLKKLRTEKGMSQTELGRQLGVTMRTIRGWELEGRYPRTREMYDRLAEILECDVDYLRTDREDFITQASELYGTHAEKQAEQILEQTAALFAGGDLSDEEQIEFLNEIQSLYLDSKQRSRKYTPKKYREE